MLSHNKSNHQQYSTHKKYSQPFKFYAQSGTINVSISQQFDIYKIQVR